MKLLATFVLLLLAGFVYSDEPQETVDQINTRYLPYSMKSLSFYVTSPAFQRISSSLTENESRRIYKVQFSQSGYEISVDETLKKKVEAEPNGPKAIQAGKADVESLVRYLYGFYFGEVVSSSMTRQVETDGSYSFFYDYTYKDIQSRNTVKFIGHRLDAIEVSIVGNPKPEVETKFSFQDNGPTSYLSSFSATNYRHGFRMLLEIKYSEQDDLLIPNSFLVTIDPDTRAVKFPYSVYGAETRK